jgi:uncharacterized membrane protein
MNKKTIALLTVMCFLTLSISQCNAGDPKPAADSLCYGFIVPLLRYENASFDNQIYCKARNMVNDLLREQMPVYWTSKNLTASIKEINHIEEEKEMFFEKGSFVIPFTGNDTIDTKIIAIICDYNQSSEIEENGDAKVPAYLLVEQLNIRGYVLSEVKIAQYLNFLTCGESWYSHVASKCGFLDFDFINNKDTCKKLNNSAYNLLIWPGYDTYYPASLATLEVMLDLSSGRNTAIRKFVSNGGGFVGSCYAVNMASRGIKPYPVYSAKKAHNPNLPSIGYLSIADIVSAKGKVIIPGLEQQILNFNHPVVYGVDNYLVGGWGSGPMIVNAGQGVDVIAEFRNDSKLGGTPSIVSNEFGNGKVVLFCPHPEINDPDVCPKFWDLGTAGTYNGKKLVSNSFYYATSQKETEKEVSGSRTMSFISDIWNETVNLSGLLNEQEEVFGNIKSSIDESVKNIVNLTGKIYSILDVIQQIADEQNIKPNEKKDFFYYSGTEYSIYCLDLIQEYLENTSITLQTIEKIYPLLDNDPHFIKLIQNLKGDLSFKMDEIKGILSVCLIKIQKMEDILESYKEHPGFINIKEKIFKKASHDIEIQTKYAFQDMPMGYFDSLKFLRTSWYNHEASIAI